MDRMLVVVFGDESKAYEGKTALYELSNEGNIAVYAYAILKKNSDGSSTVKQDDDGGPYRTLLGTSVGALIGLLAGPVGAVVGATAGMLGGMTDDLNNTRVGSGFVQDVSDRLLPGTVALIAEVDEDWTAPVDTHMERLGGEVFRKALSDVHQQVNDEDISSIKADIVQLKAEHAQAQAERKEKLHHKIDALEAKLQATMAAAKQKREKQEEIAKAKVALLKEKAVAMSTRS